MRGEVRPDRREGVGHRRPGGGEQAACTRGGPDSRLGVRARVERTSNMCCMFVTLDVSRLSGWLNANAVCRDSKGRHAMRGEVRPGRQE